MENISVIGIAGRIGSGKDHLANYLKNTYFQDAVLMSFADQLKLHCMFKANPTSITNTDKIYKTYFHSKPPEVRKQIQEYGCNARESNEEIWINMLYAQMLMLKDRGITTFIIPDVRFENERDFIKSIGGKIIKVVAPTRNNEATKHLSDESRYHLSESFVDSMECYIIINNDIHQNFEKNVQEAMLLINLK